MCLECQSFEENRMFEKNVDHQKLIYIYWDNFIAFQVKNLSYNINFKTLHQECSLLD